MAVSVSEGRLWAGLPSQVCRPSPRIGTCRSSTDSGRGGPGSQKRPGGGPGGPRNASGEGPGCLQGVGPGPASVLPEEEAGRAASCTPLPRRWRLRRSRSPPVPLWARRWGLGAHGEQSTGVPASGSPGDTHGALHPPRPRMLHLSISKRQRGPRHLSSRLPPSDPLWGGPAQMAPRCPPFPSKARPDPPGARR